MHSDDTANNAQCPIVFDYCKRADGRQSLYIVPYALALTHLYISTLEPLYINIVLIGLAK